ncbi:PDZ domain-containing protein [uncultured Cocleimonas sp.]|uniref:PDZ domain-containing protein n=1 Tax=uncultured Cocleimonas sp. TaxID=1051587 RepID=UPI002622F642|nr:PDZ domain-containing protein [uncultured Cocleimonas sp.]
MKIRIQNITAPIFAIALTTGVSQAQSPVFPPDRVFPQQPVQMYPQMPNAPYGNPYGQMNMPAVQNNQNLQAQPQKPLRELSGYLGIVLDLVPEAVTAQLPQGVKQGVLIKSFSENSPAKSSELKPYDVMFAYDDIKLNHPAQFIKIVRDDKPGREVKIKVVRKGEILKIPVVIGAQKTPDPKEFNGLAIKQIGKDKYRAIVRFVGPSGNKQIRSYEGNRAEIFEQAQYAQDLPPAERQQLLYATRPRNKKSNNGFGNFFPFGGNNNSGGDFMNPRKYFNW